MSISTEEILCSRCGTPFPIERGKPAITCVVCGQLRPDLDMDLDEDDEDLTAGLGVGAAGVSIKASTTVKQEELVSPPARAVMAPSYQADMESRTSFRANTNYMSMSESYEGASLGPKAPSDSLASRLGPILLIVAPLASGMLGALNMLSQVEDFSKGSWYAVGTVFGALLLGTIIGGLICSWVLYSLRMRWTFMLRCVYLAVGVAMTYYGLTVLSSHVQVRENNFPEIVLRR